MRRLFDVVVLVTAVTLFTFMALAVRHSGYQRGYKDGLIDGSNSGFLEGQKSVDCPGTVR